MIRTAHGTIECVDFTTRQSGDDSWTVSATIDFTAEAPCRLPLTFSVLTKAMTKLVSFEKGENRLSYSFELEAPIKNNPLSFIGTDETEVFIRLDGETVKGSAKFAKSLI